jgi:hypothetical protein
MLKNFEDFQKLGKENVDTCMKQFGTVSKGWQAIAAEFADYSKKSFEHGSAALESLLGAKSLEKAIEIQSDYVKTAYEGFVARRPRWASSTPISRKRPTSRSKASSRRSRRRSNSQGLCAPSSLPDYSPAKRPGFCFAGNVRRPTLDATGSAG